MNIIRSYNPEEKRVIFFVESNLLIDYFSNFSGLIKKNIEIEGTKVERMNESKAMISFPLPEESQITKVSEDKMAISLRSDIVDKITDVINRFASAAIRKKLRTIEFLPLHGYPEEDLKNDVVSGVKAKRNFTILKDYSEYKAMERRSEYNFNQVFLRYGTPEYSDAALDILKGDINALEERLKNKFKRCEWV